MVRIGRSRAVTSRKHVANDGTGARDMPYNRRYSLDAIHQILCDSERRKRPSGGAEPGHAITQHADGRSDVVDKRHRSIIHLFATLEETRASGPIPNGYVVPPKAIGRDSRFLSRLDLIRSIYQALNSPTGQAELARLGTARRGSPSRSRSIGRAWGSGRNPSATRRRRSARARRRRRSRRQGRRPCGRGSPSASSSWLTEWPRATLPGDPHPHRLSDRGRLKPAAKGIGSRAEKSALDPLGTRNGVWTRNGGLTLLAPLGSDSLAGLSDPLGALGI